MGFVEGVRDFYVIILSKNYTKLKNDTILNV